MSSHSILPFAGRDLGALPGMRFVLPPEVVPEISPEPQSIRQDVPIDELSFRHLKSGAEMAQVSHLRQQIQLPAAALADPGFGAREKKETSKASWVRLCFAGFLSERSASSRWIAGLPPAKQSFSANRCCRRPTTKPAGKWAGLCLHPSIAVPRKR